MIRWFLALCSALLPHLAWAQTTPQLLDFEDRAPGTAIFNQYPGLTVLGGDSSPPRSTVDDPPAGTVSGTQALRCDNRGEFSGSVVPLSFDVPQQRIKLSVGLVDGAPSGAYLVLRGYAAADPTSTQQRSPIVESETVFVGPAPTPVDLPLEIVRSQGDLRSAFVYVLVEPDGRSMDFVDVAIDNLEYDAPIELPPPDDVAPVVTFTSPTPGATVEGGAPGALEMHLRGEVLEDEGLRQLTLSLNGGPAERLRHDGGRAGRYDFLASLFASDGLRDGANDAVVTAEDFAGNVGAASLSFTYAMKPVPPPTDVDVVPIGLELNQGVSFGPLSVLRPEADGFSVQVPDYLTFVQGRDTLVRVYAVAQGATGPLADVPAVMTVIDDDCEGGCRLGELVPLADANTALHAIDLPAAGTDAASLEGMSRDLDATWNFLIPAAWTERSLRLLVDVNTPAQGGPDRVPECRADFLGECERGNRITARATFREPHRATVSPVLVTLGSEAATFADLGTVLRSMDTLYPTRFDLGRIRGLTVAADIGGERLLRTVQDRFGCRPAHISDPGSWLACGFDPRNFQPAVVPRTPTGGPPGAAVRGNNAYYTVANPITPAHEAGHAIGFQHASCDHDEASGGGCDDYYPGEHGRLLGIGFDRANWALVVDTDTSHAHDFMSYGAPSWVSTYLWNITADHPYVGDVDYDWCLGWTGPYECGLSQADARRGAQEPSETTEVLWVRGEVHLDGTATLLDAYRMRRTIDDAPPAPNEPTLRLEGLDADGNTLVTVPFRSMPVQSEAPLPDQFAVALPLAPGVGRRLVELRVRQGAEVVGTLEARTDGAFAVGAVVVEGGAGAWARDEVQRVRWGLPSGVDLTSQIELHLPEEPALVLASQWPDDALDVVVADLPSAVGARLVVRVSDGVRTTIVQSAPFDIAPGAPQVLIVEPAGPVQVTEGVAVSLWGVGSDDRGPLPESRLRWSLDSGRVLGGGSRAVAAELPVGTHVVTLAADGSDALATVEITVVGTTGSSGCGCTTASGQGWGWLAGLALLLRGRRRRASAASSTSARG